MALEEHKLHEQVQATSPDGNVTITFSLDNEGRRPTYSIAYRGRPVVSDSHLGLVLGGAAPLVSHFDLEDVRTAKVDEAWIPVYGEKASIPDRYHEVTAVLRECLPPHREVHIQFRAYDEGAAFRYIIPRQRQGENDEWTIVREETQFRFPDNCYAYEEHGTEGEYFLKPVREIKPRCERPLTIQYQSGMFASLFEADAFDYPRMLLSPHRRESGVLVTDLDGPARGVPSFSTPWRGFVVGDRPGDLLERNYLVLNLSPPCSLDDTSWIKPGKAIREVTLTTKGGKACVDFAVQHNLQYIEYDAGWYGPEWADESDATAISVDPGRKSPEWDGLDLQEVIRYAAQRGIGVFLYVNRRALERQMDVVFPLFREWGVAGVKFGFVEVGEQTWTRWLHDAVRKAAEHRLLVDIHDAYRPSGFSRTYPNLLTQEGIRGNEHMPTARHNATLPFTRFVAGAGDYTICYYSDRIKTTHAHQLALAVINYSPLQFLFWYDRPSAYQGEPEVEFFEHVPTVWDDTRVIDGAIGEFVTIARRKGDEWYLGSITNENPRKLEIPLTFLEPGKRYLAHSYSDDPSGKGRTAVRIETQEVHREMLLTATLPAIGGQAVRLVPIN